MIVPHFENTHKNLKSIFTPLLSQLFELLALSDCNSDVNIAGVTMFKLW